MKEGWLIPECLCGRKILVVGDLMIDQYIHGNVERISPEAPVPVLDVTRTLATLGGAGNVVKNLLTLETDVTVCSVIGSDKEGSNLFEMLSLPGIDTEGVFIDLNRKTSIKTRVVSGVHQIVRIDKEDRTPISESFTDKIISYVNDKN